MATETNAEIISVCGSKPIEKYLGVGPNRIRDIFEEAREISSQKVYVKGEKTPRLRPVIIFIDELDALSKRSAGNAVNMSASI